MTTKKFLLQECNEICLSIPGVSTFAKKENYNNNLVYTSAFVTIRDYGLVVDFFIWVDFHCIVTLVLTKKSNILHLNENGVL